MKNALLILLFLSLGPSFLPAQNSLVERALQGSPGPTVGPDRAQLRLVWKKDLGPGNSRIAVATEIAVTLFSDRQSDFMVALNRASGNEVWRYRIGETYHGHDGSIDGPHASPVIVDGIVYGLGPHGHLFALDLDSGKALWRRDIRSDLGAVEPFWGFASTPVVEGNVVVIPTANPEGRSVSGFDRHSGHLLWSTGRDRTGYQSATAMTLAGTRQVVAVTNQWLFGLEPSSGRVLWSHQYSENNLDGSSEAVAVDQHHFLLTSSVTEFNTPGMLFKLFDHAPGFGVEKVWESNGIRGNYTRPIVWKEMLFGLRGNILSGIDLDTGKPLWRSREPSAVSLTRFRDRMALVTHQGAVVIGRLDRGEYLEEDRLPVFERGAFTEPTIHGQTIFVRTHEQIAAVEISTSKTLPALATAPSNTLRHGRFADFIRELGQAEDPAARIDAFFETQTSFPIVEGDRLVHFVYRGPASDVAVLGPMTEWGIVDPLHRVQGTDLFFRTYELEPAGWWSYAFSVDYGRFRADPLNPRVAPGGWNALREFTTPGWEAPDHLTTSEGTATGTQKLEFRSELLGNTRDLEVYFRSDDAGRQLPLLLVLNGGDALEHGQMARWLEHLWPSELEPFVAVFVGRPKTPYRSYQEFGGPQSYLEFGGPQTAEFARMLAEELVPFLEQRLPLRTSSDARALLGEGPSGLSALYTAVHFPAVFGKVAVQSMTFGPTPTQSSNKLRRPIYDSIRRRLDAPKRPALVFYLDWASYDLRNNEGIDLARDNRLLQEFLVDRGYEVHGGQYPGGPGWGSWRAQTGSLLKALFPSR